MELARSRPIVVFLILLALCAAAPAIAQPAVMPPATHPSAASPQELEAILARVSNEATTPADLESALNRLTELGAAANSLIPKLESLAMTGRAVSIVRASKALAALNTPQTIPSLVRIACIRAMSEATADAVKALRSKGAAALPAVSEAARSSLSGDRATAIRLLGHLGASAIPVLNELARGKTTPDIKTAIDEAMLEAKAHSARDLAAIFKAPSTYDRGQISRAFGRFDVDVLPAVVEVMGDTDAAVADKAAGAASAMLSDAKRFADRRAPFVNGKRAPSQLAPELVQMLQSQKIKLQALVRSSQPEVRKAAEAMLRAAGDDPATAFAAALDDPNPAVRKEAIAKLATDQREKAVPALSRLASADRDEDVRRTAAIRLLSIEDAGRRERIIAALKSHDRLLQSAALRSVVGHEEGYAILMDAAATADADVRPDLLFSISNDPSGIVLAMKILSGEDKSRYPLALDVIARGFGENVQYQKGQELIPRAAARIRQLLADSSPEVRQTAVKAMSRMGKAASDTTMQSLASDDPKVRAGTAAALAQMDRVPASAIPSLKQVAADPDPLVRIDAVMALGHVGPVAVPAIVPLLDDKHPEVWQAAIDALMQQLRRTDTDGHAAARAILQATMHGNPYVRNSAMAQFYERRGFAESMRRLDPNNPALKSLPASVWSTAPDEQDASAPSTQPASRPATGPAWQADVTAFVPEVAKPLARQTRTLEQLLQVLSDPQESEMQRLRATREIAKGSKAPSAVAPLALLLRQARTWQLRAGASDALGAVGGSSPEAVKALLAALDDANIVVVENSILALGRLGADASDAVPALVQLMAGPEMRRSNAAVKALGQIGRPAVPALIAFIKQPTEDRRRILAVQVLAAIGPQATEAAPTLVELLHDSAPASADTRLLNALAKMGPAAKAAVPDLLRIAKDEKALARRDAILAVGSIGQDGASDDAVAVLVNLLSDWKVANAAASALGRLGPGAAVAVPALMAKVRLEVDNAKANHPPFGFPSNSLGLTAVEALGGIGPTAKQALPLLREARTFTQNTEGIPIFEAAIRSIGAPPK